MKSNCVKCNSDFHASSKFRRTCYICKPHKRQAELSKWLAYYDEGHSVKETAARFEVSHSTFHDLLKTFGDPRPAHLRLSDARRQKPLELNIPWLDGWLLGDGCVQGPKGTNKTPYLRHGSSKGPYTAYARFHFMSMGLWASDFKPYTNPSTGHKSFHVDSQAHVGLQSLYDRWYPGGIKVPPSDLIMSPTVLREWFIGDGCMMRGHPCIILMSYDEDKVNFLYDLICQAAPSPNFHTRPRTKTERGSPRRIEYSFYWKAADIDAFFDYIGPCPSALECYAYKWPAVIEPTPALSV